MTARANHQFQPTVEPLQDRILLSAPPQILRHFIFNRPHQRVNHIKLRYKFPRTVQLPSQFGNHRHPVVFHPNGVNPGLHLPRGAVMIPNQVDRGIYRGIY